MSSINREYENYEIEEAISRIETTYRDLDLYIHPSSELGKCLKYAKNGLKDCDANIFMQKGGKRQFHKIVEGTLESLRISEIIRRVDKKIRIQGHLQKMLKGLLDPTISIRSAAKDALFELEVLEHLLAANLEAEISEPDVVFAYDNSKFSIACKCLYSEKNIIKQFKKARDQIYKSTFPGIIALNISSILDHSCFFSANSEAEFEKIISETGRGFLYYNKKKFNRAINTYAGISKVMGVFIVINTFTRWINEMRISLGSKISVDSFFPQYHPSAVTLYNIADIISKRSI